MTQVQERPAIVSFGWSGEKRDIKVVLKNGVWHTVHYVDGKPDQLMVKLFGTNELPTPWSSEVDRDTVINELKVRNRNASIS